MSLAVCSRLSASHCGNATSKLFNGTRHACTSNVRNIPVLKIKQTLPYGRRIIREWANGRAQNLRTFCLTLPRVISLDLGTKQKLACSIALFPLSFKFFKRKDTDSVPQAHSIDDISAETLAVIPKDVFKKDKVRSTQRKGNMIYRIVFAVWDTTQLLVRFLRITFTFGPIFALYPLTWLGEGVRYRWLQLMMYALGKTGPTFVKLGQWVSSRRDLFKDDVCDMFNKLHSHTRLHSWFMTRRKLSKAFGPRWRDLFVAFERKPIGSGCIAQVHRAYMKTLLVSDESILEDVMSCDDPDEPMMDFAEGLEVVGFTSVSDAIEDLITQPTNKEEVVDLNYASAQPSEPASQAAEEAPDVITVAVKVLHPGTYRSVMRDLTILRAMTAVMATCVPGLRWLNLSDCMNEFSVLLIKQIDLRSESACLEQFVKNFEDNPNIRFPRPIWPFCKRAVLVETYEEGVPITKYLSDPDGDEVCPAGLKERLASYGVDALLQMLFVDNFVHGDMHPGNILVQNADDYVPQEGNKMMMVDLCDTLIVTVRPVETPVRLVLLDTGVTATLSDPDLQNLKEVFCAVIVGEGDEVAELILKHARYHDCQDISGFRTELGDVVRHFREETIRLGKIKVGELLSQVYHVCCRHKVQMESNFSSVILAIFVMEGISRSLDPDLDILERAKPILLGNVRG